MKAPRRLGPLAETTVMLAFGLAAIYAALLPLGFAADRAPGPDLVYCLVAAWVIRRPGEAPLAAVVALGLAADVLLSRPIGLGALGLLLASEALRASAPSLRAGPFAAEWLTVAGLHAAVQLCIHAVLLVALVDGPGPGALLRHAAATAIAYPAVVGVLALAVGLRAGRRGREAGRLGRLA
jgi:rod shape-determining protein MreD